MDEEKPVWTTLSNLTNPHSPEGWEYIQPLVEVSWILVAEARNLLRTVNQRTEDALLEAEKFLYDKLRYNKMTLIAEQDEFKQIIRTLSESNLDEGVVGVLAANFLTLKAVVEALDEDQQIAVGNTIVDNAIPVLNALLEI